MNMRAYINWDRYAKVVAENDIIKYQRDLGKKPVIVEYNLKLRRV